MQKLDKVIARAETFSWEIDPQKPILLSFCKILIPRKISKQYYETHMLTALIVVTDSVHGMCSVELWLQISLSVPGLFTGYM